MNSVWDFYRIGDAIKGWLPPNYNKYEYINRVCKNFPGSKRYYGVYNGLCPLCHHGVSPQPL